jgi:hypothetical protein
MTRAATALKLKRLALQRVYEIRAKLLGEQPEQRLLRIVRELDPGLFNRAVETARQKYPTTEFAL